MSDAETLGLLAEEADFVKGELVQALNALGEDSLDTAPLIATVQGLEESIQAVGLDDLVPMTQWVLANIERITDSDTQDTKGTLLGELLTGWLSSLIGICSNPSKPILRENFEAALERREWPIPMDGVRLAEIIGVFGDAGADQHSQPDPAWLEEDQRGGLVDLRPAHHADPRKWERFILQTSGEGQLLAQLLEEARGEVFGELAREAENLAHSVRNAALEVGLTPVAQLAGTLEELLESMEEGEIEDRRKVLVLAGAAVLQSQLAHLGQAQAPAEADATSVIQEMRELLDEETAWASSIPESPPASQIDTGLITRGSDDLATILMAESGSGLLDDPDDDLGMDFERSMILDELPDSHDEIEQALTESLIAAGQDMTSLRFSPDTDPRLLEAFFLETPDLVTQLVELLRGCAEGQLVGDAVMEAQRLAHTIKGGCSFVGLPAVYDLSYPLEEGLEGLGTSPPSDDYGELLIEVADVLEFLFECIKAEAQEAPLDIRPFVEKLWEWAKLLNPQEEDEYEEDPSQEEPSTADPDGDDTSQLTPTAAMLGEEETDLRFGEDVDPRLLEAFFIETPEQAEQLVALLRQAGEQALQGEDMYEAQRLAHTIKGSCAFVGLWSIQRLSHPLEEALEGLAEAEAPPPPAFAELLVEVADVLELLFECLKEGENSAPLDSSPFVSSLWDWAQQLNPGEESLAEDLAPAEVEPQEAPPVHVDEPAQEPPASVQFLDEDLEASQLFKDLPRFDLDAVDAPGVNTRLAEDLDPQLVEAFFLETPDQVAELAELLRSSASGEFFGDQVTEAQRLAHTVKGACAMAGLDQIRDLAHHLEDVLEVLEVAAPPPALGDLLIETGDSLEALFDVIQAGEDSANIDIDGLISGMQHWAQQLSAGGYAPSVDAPAQPSAAAEWVDIALADDLDPRLAEAFFVETPDQVSELAVLLRAADQGGMVGDLVTEAQRLAHTVKGACALVGLMQVQVFAHRLEDVLEGLGDKPPAEDLVSLLVETADSLETIFDAVAAKESTVAVNMDALIVRLGVWASKLSGIADEEMQELDLGEELEISPEDLLWDENVDPKMLDEFFIEVPDQAAALSRLIYEHQIQQDQPRADAARLAGSIEHWSRTVGIHPLRLVGQNLKNIFISPRSEPFSDVALGVLEESAELLDNLVAAIQGKVDPVKDAGEKIRDLAQWASRVVDSAKAQRQQAPTAAAPAAAKPEQGKASAESSLRVPTSRIVSLMRLVGEMTTAVAQLQGRLTPVLEYVTAIHRQGLVTSQRLADLETLVEVRSKPADEESADFDPLEMDQYHELHGIASALNEAFVDSQEIARLAEDQLQDLAAIAHRQERLSRDVNEAVLATRMMPVSVLVPRLERTVREACRAAGKKARIVVDGEYLLADTDIIGGLRDALMHMLRNSIDHGIEAPEERLAKRKSEEGRLDISFRRQGNTILIRVLDDGGGFNIDRIRETAAKRGLKLDAGLADNELLRLILMPGFSTKQGVTTLSGRGIGMDVVRQSVEELGGSLVLNNRPEGGAETSIRLPLTLVSAPVLLVRSQDQVFAIPSDDVNQILYPDEGSIYLDTAGWRFRLGEENYRVWSMAALIGRGLEEQDFREYRGKTVLLVQDDLGYQGILLDQALESRDVVVQPLGPWLTMVRGVSGACILASGDVAPILDIRSLLRERNTRSLSETLDKDFFENYFADTIDHIPVVMVVDDSLSARKSLEIAVEAAGYEVLSAIDGLDAIQVMEGKRPDLILADMEMPKMNGLELTTHVRAQPETRDIPLIMVTSRSTKKHRERAMAAGVSHYLTKPFDHDQLHQVMRDLLQRAAV